MNAPSTSCLLADPPAEFPVSRLFADRQFSVQPRFRTSRRTIGTLAKRNNRCPVVSKALPVKGTLTAPKASITSGVSAPVGGSMLTSCSDPFGSDPKQVTPYRV